MKKYAAFAPSGTDAKGFGPVVIVVRIGKNYKKTIKTGIRIKPSEWDVKKELVKSGVPKCYDYNTVIKTMLSDIEQWEIKTVSAGYMIRKENFLKWLEGDAEPESFNDFYLKSVNDDKSLVHSSKTDQMQTYKLMNEYNSSVLFSDLNRRFVDGFENFLIEKKYSQNTRKKHHKNIKKYINLAIDYGHLKITLDRHPYRSVKYPTRPSTRTFLTNAELRKIENYNYVGRMSEVRDLFLFSCFTGLRFSDCQLIGPSNFKDGVLTYTPQKTQKHTGDTVIPLEEFFSGKALKIAERFNFNFPKITNQEINRYLKDIMIDTEIDKLLTFHVSRHTFLTHIAFESGNIFKVMKYGGLRKSETAMIYVHLAGV